MSPCPVECSAASGFRGGSYIDQTVIPLTGGTSLSPDKQIRGIHRGFASPVFFPMRGKGDAELLRRAQRRTDEPSRHPGATSRDGSGRR